MVGIGPFVVLSVVAQIIGGPYFLYAWIAGAFLSYLDAMVWSQLGSALPKAGGSFHFLKEGYGEKWGKLMSFLFVWQTMIQAPLVIASAAIGFSQYANYFFHFNVWQEKLVKGEVGMNEVYNVLHGYSQYPAGATKLLFTANHDENSWNGTEYEKYGAAAKAWAVFTQTWKGIPLIYSGQELPNHKRLPFFDKGQIEWTPAPALHEFYKTLSTLRKTHTAIINGETINLPVATEGVMAYIRQDATSTLFVLLNLSNQHHKVEIAHEKLNGEFQNGFSGIKFNFNHSVPFELLPGDFFVYVKG